MDYYKPGVRVRVLVLECFLSVRGDISRDELVWLAESMLELGDS
jgi:hypothetical protein